MEKCYKFTRKTEGELETHIFIYSRSVQRQFFFCYFEHRLFTFIVLKEMYFFFLNSFVHRTPKIKEVNFFND